jgi:maleylacetate reductase
VITPFTYQALPMRVRFGAGSLASLPDEVAALGLTRVLVLCSPEQEDTAKLVADALGDRAAGLLPEARMHFRSTSPTAPATGASTRSGTP